MTIKTSSEIDIRNACLAYVTYKSLRLRIIILNANPSLDIWVDTLQRWRWIHLGATHHSISCQTNIYDLTQLVAYMMQKNDQDLYSCIKNSMHAGIKYYA